MLAPLLFRRFPRRGGNYNGNNNNGNSSNAGLGCVNLNNTRTNTNTNYGARSGSVPIPANNRGKTRCVGGYGFPQSATGTKELISVDRSDSLP